ncbi:MAG: hypothetical protein IJY96_05105 [Oscillospiraceae bacterium]|nr:hypothetical protein [Oscillospiraceae bacterium]
MSDIRESPYANWLEDMCAAVFEHKPVQIGICAINPDGTVLTAYYGEPNHADKAQIAHHIYSDAMMDIVMANAADVVEAAEEEGEDDG